MEYLIGEIIMSAAHAFLTRGSQNFLVCDGSTLSIASEQALFSVIGTTYGGDGVTTFKLPDLRGRIPVGVGQGQASAFNYALGQTFGQETVTLTEANLPLHIHSVFATSTTATSSSPAPNMALASPAPNLRLYSNLAPDETNAPLRALAPQAVGAGGGNNPHPNLMPTAYVIFLICRQGVFPHA